MPWRCHCMSYVGSNPAVMQQLFILFLQLQMSTYSMLPNARRQQSSIACHQYSRKLVVLQFVTCANKDFTSLHGCRDRARKFQSLVQSVDESSTGTCRIMLHGFRSDDKCTFALNDTPYQHVSNTLQLKGHLHQVRWQGWQGTQAAKR